MTGASRGIGRAVALRLAANGFKVVVAYAGNDAKAAETVEAIAQAGGVAIAARGDVSSPHDVKALFTFACERFGSVQVVVHSAGVIELAPVAVTSLDVFDKVVAINCAAPSWCWRKRLSACHQAGGSLPYRAA